MITAVINPQSTKPVVFGLVKLEEDVTVTKNDGKAVAKAQCTSDSPALASFGERYAHIDIIVKEKPGTKQFFDAFTARGKKGTFTFVFGELYITKKGTSKVCSVYCDAVIPLSCVNLGLEGYEVDKSAEVIAKAVDEKPKRSNTEYDF